MTQIRSILDAEILSAYLDNQLSMDDKARLETRLATEPILKDILTDLQEAQFLLKNTPKQHVPRNFFLTPKMAGVHPPLPRSFPVFRLASVTAALLLFLSFAVNLIQPISAAPSNVSAPSGYGGGCDSSIPGNCGDTLGALERGSGFGGGPKENLVQEPPTIMSAAPVMPGTPTPEATAESGMKIAEQPSEVAAMPAEELPETQPASNTNTETRPWLNGIQITMIALFLFFGAMALAIRQFSIAKWQKRQ